jgi:hypothetical protein
MGSEPTKKPAYLSVRDARSRSTGPFILPIISETSWYWVTGEMFSIGLVDLSKTFRLKKTVRWCKSMRRRVGEREDGDGPTDFVCSPMVSVPSESRRGRCHNVLSAEVTT